MEDKRLTLENVEEIGLELLKEENGNSDEISLYYNYDEEITKETMEEVREIKKANEYETLYDAFKNYLSEVNFDYIDDLKDELVKRTIENNSDYPYESEEYQELFDKAVEIVEGNFSINVNTNDILKNTRVRDVAVILSPNDNENFYLSNFNISEEFRDDVPQDSPMFFLIQSQGYEVEDLYDDEKVENSPFLKSLSKEVKGFWEEVKIGFYTNMNLRDLIDLEESNENIVIPKFIESDLVLEKEIVISRDKVKIYSDYSEEQEESNYTIGGFVREEIINTNEKAFEIHEVDKEKIYKIINFLEEKELQEEELEKAKTRDNLYPPKDEEKFNKDKKEMQGELLNYLEEKGYIEKEKEEYKFKKDVLEKDNFESYADDFLSQSLEFKNDVFTKNFSAKNLVERFDLKLPDFKIYNNENGEMIYNSETRENIFRNNLTDEELLERYDIKKENFIIYSQNGDKLYDSESSLPTRDLEEYIIDIKDEEYWENLKLNDVKSWDNLLKENLVIGQMKSTEEEFENYEEYTRNHLEEIADYTITEVKLIFGEVRQDLIRNSEKGLISEEKLEMLENRYSNFNEKEVKATEKDSRVKSEEYWLNKVENNKDKYKEEISNIKANFLSSFLKDNIPNYEKMSSAIELPKEDLKEKLNGNFNDYCLENYIWENDSLKEKIHNSFPLNEMIKRYGLEDELPAFKVYDNEDELLFDSGSKENNLKEIESFIERIDKVEFLNDLLKDTNINKIENWSKIANYDDNELMTITFNNDFFFEEETEYINSNNYEEYLGMNLTEKIDDNIDYEVLSYTNTVKDKLLELINEKEVLTKKDTEKLIEDLSYNSKEKVVNEVEEVKEKDKEIDM